jgi:hypothetical protein
MITVRALVPVARALTLGAVFATVTAASAATFAETLPGADLGAPIAASAETGDVLDIRVADIMLPDPKLPVPRHAAAKPTDPLPPLPPYAGAGIARVDLKCWQHGVLILQESRLVAATEPFPYVVKFPAPSPGGVPTYVTDSRNATCLIKSADTEPQRRR